MNERSDGETSPSWSAGRKVDKETWWWNEDVLECRKGRRVAGKKMNRFRQQENGEMKHKLNV